MESSPNPPESRSGQRPYMPTPDEYVNSLGQPALEQPVPLPRSRPPRRRKWRRFLAVVFVLLTVAVVGYAAVIINNVARISTQPFDLTGLATDTTGRTNILVLGVGDPGHSGEKLSDSMMVVSLDTRTKQVAQISLPRDLRVKVPGYGYNKVNLANALGGPKLAEQTVSDTLGIPLHYYVETNFTGLKKLVDAVGGVDVDVQQRLVDREYPCDDNPGKSCGLVIEAGRQHMDGAKALQYARCRKGTCGDDFGRAKRQQEIIGLVRDKAANWQTIVDPAKLTPVTAALRDGLETDMGAVQLIQLALDWQAAQKNQPIHLVLSTAKGGYLKGSRSGGDLLPADGTFDAIQERVQNIFSVPPQPGDVPES